MKLNVLLSVLVLALVGALIAPVSQGEEKKSEAKAKIGEKAPDFELKDQNGKTVKLSQFKGKIVVLEWFCESCPVVVGHYKEDTNTMNKLAAKYKDKDVVWLTINSTDGTNVESNKKAAAKMKIDRPILDDSSGKVGKIYAARTTPHMYVVNKEGVLVYDGAIDNQKQGQEAVNYVDQACGEVLAGKEVSTPKTKPYGCGVKYAS